MKHVFGTALIFIILLIEDFCIGIFSGYTISGNGDFWTYLYKITFEHIFIIFVAAIIIYLIIRRVFKI